MKSNEFIHEAEKYTQESEKIVRTLIDNGYTQLGSGADATVWTKDVGHVIKIIMPENLNITRAAHTFKKFYEFCITHSNLDCLPRFIPINGEVYTEFRIGNRKYMQISMEQLYPLEKGSFDHGVVYNLGVYATQFSWDRVTQLLSDSDEWENYLYEFKLSGIPAEQYSNKFKSLSSAKKNKLKVLYNVMTMLYSTGTINKFRLDIHTENVMRRRDGTLVIIDPWFNGQTSS